MSRKRTNMMKIWKEMGYKIKRFNGESNSAFYFSEINFVKESGKPVSFINDWDEIKAMLKRQELYGLPVTESDVQKYACVRVIDYSLITEVEWACKTTIKMLESNYWYIQKNTNLTRCVHLLQAVEQKGKDLQLMIRRSVSGTDYTQYFDTDVLLANFMTMALEYSVAYNSISSFRFKLEHCLSSWHFDSYNEYTDLYKK